MPASPPISTNCLKVGLTRASSSSQNSPFTATSMIDSGVSLLVARCRTCVTPAIASATLWRFSIEPENISRRGRGGSLRLWQSARTTASARDSSASSRAMNVCPTLPVAPVTRMRMLTIAPPSRVSPLLLQLAQLRPERRQVVLIDPLDGGVDEGRDGLAVAEVLERLHGLIAELERALDDGREDRSVLDAPQGLLFFIERDDQRLHGARRRPHGVAHARAIVGPQADCHHQVRIAGQRVLHVLLGLVPVGAVEEQRQDLDALDLAQRL